MKFGPKQYAALVLAVAAGLGYLIDQQVFDAHVTAALGALVVVVKAYLNPPSTPEE